MTALSVLFGKRVKEIRESKNIKQVELANMIDVEATNLSKLEKGIHLPKEENIKKIADALQVDICDLFNFGHIKTRKELMSDIKQILADATDEELRFFHKILVSYKELN